MTVHRIVIFSKGDDIRNWQDGLRALLPNINISFSGTVVRNEEMLYIINSIAVIARNLEMQAAFMGLSPNATLHLTMQE